MRRTLAMFMLVSALVPMLAGPANAQTAPTPAPAPAPAPAAAPAPGGEATRLFDEARAHVDAGRWAEACPLFQSSYQLDPAPGTALNLGECAERDGKPRIAWQMYTAAMQDYRSEGKTDQADIARERADAVAGKLALVTIRIAAPGVPGLTLQIGDRTLPAMAEILERIDREAITITAQAPGHAPFTTTVQGDRDQVVEIPALQPLVAPGPVGPAPPERRPRPWKAVTLTGVAVTVISVFVASLDGSQAAKYTGSAFLFGGVTTSFVGLALRRSPSSSARRASTARPPTAALAPVIGPDRVAATLRFDW